MTLRTLHLEFNLIADASVVIHLLQWGTGGELHLKGVPCVEELLRHEAEKAAAAGKKTEETAPVEELPPEPAQKKPGSGKGHRDSVVQAITIPGWRLILQ